MKYPRSARVRPGSRKFAALALAIVDRDGPEALTLARVAESAGVATPSLYKHVGGLADLRHRVSVRVMGELAEKVRRSVVGVSGDAAVVALLRAYRDYLVEYPHAAGLLVNPAASEPAGELLDVVLAVLGGFGYPEDLAETFELLGVRSPQTYLAS